MTFNRINSSLFQSSLLNPLIYFVLISYFYFFVCASAFPQPAEEPLQKTLELRQLSFHYIEEQPEYVQINFRLSVDEDATWYDDLFLRGGLERMRQDPDTVSFYREKPSYPIKE